MPIFERVKQAWNAFVNTNNPAQQMELDYSATSYYTAAPPSRQRPRYSSERSIISSIYTRISIDTADVDYRHVKIDNDGRYVDDIDDSLNYCLRLEPNLDQAPRSFRQDITMTLFDKGCAAIVPVDTALDPNTHETFDIYTMRVGEITTWYPQHVKVNVYNEANGQRQEVVLDKRFVAIVENPLFSVMNEPNSTFQRLVRKLNLLDVVDEQSSSGKLDIIIQLPYVIKSEARRQQAEQRRQDIEFQLKGSQYGIAYTDGTEKITQLNRPAENNLLGQIEYLTKMLYAQLGITDAVMDGTADEKTMINYYNRTVKPIIESVVEAMQRSFIGPTRLMNNERIFYFKDPFKLVPISDIAEIADKFTRNEILSSNEIRGFMGIPPANDPKADQLINKNMPVSDTGLQVAGSPPQAAGPTPEELDSIMNQAFDSLDAQINDFAGQNQNG